MNARSLKNNPYLTGGLVLVGAIIPFIPALQAHFVNWDDTLLVTGNPAIHGLGLAWVGEWFTSFYLNHYHPMLMFTYAVEYALAGYEPILFHATNLLLHGLNAVLVLMLLRFFVKDRLAMVFAVLFFALHPLRVEPVVWVSARNDLLSTFFILSCVIVFLRYADTRKTSLLVVSFGLALLAALSKAIAVVIPFLLLAVLLYGPQRKAKPKAATLAPFFGLALVTAVLAVIAQYPIGHTPYEPDQSFLRGITLPFGNIVFYAWKTILPIGLSNIYPFPENGGPDLLMFSVVSLLVLSVTAIIVIILRPERQVMFGLVWIFVCLAPVVQWIPAGPSFAADRFTYLPAIGLSVLLGIGLERMLHAKKGMYRPLVRRAGILLLAALGTASFVQAGVWEKSVTLWTNTLEAYPLYSEGYVYLGTALADEEQNMVLAVEAFSASIRLDDRNPDAFTHRALASYRSSRPDSTQIISDLTSAIALAPGSIENQVFLAEVYYDYGQTERAFNVCSALLDAYPLLNRARLLRLRCAFEMGYEAILNEDVEFLKNAGIDVSIERNGASRD